MTLHQSEATLSYPTELKALDIADRHYSLHSRNCSCCGEEFLEIWRWSGPSFSRYAMPPDFQSASFADFVRGIDAELLMSSNKLIAEFISDLNEVNDASGIRAEDSFAFRLLEYGRHRASSLRKAGLLDALTAEEIPLDETASAVRTAFELGSAAAEHRMMQQYEEYIAAGLALSEWRNAGLPKAKAERLRQGKQSRAAVLKAAENLYASDPDLVRNDSETARRILALKLPELTKRNGGHLGVDAITRHLRTLRPSQRVRKGKAGVAPLGKS